MGLRGFFFAASLCTLVSCTISPKPVPIQQADQNIDAVVRDAQEYIKKDDAPHAAGLLEQHVRQKQEIKPNYSLDISGYYLLAFSYVSNNAFSHAETLFRILVDWFELNPLIVEEIHDKLNDFMNTDAYYDAKELLYRATGPFPKLNAVYAFACLAEHDYAGARDGFEAALPHFPGKKKKYKRLFEKLSADAKKNRDFERMIGYEYVAKAFR